MKNLKLSIAWVAIFALIFTSCSKDEAGVVSDEPETVQLTFGALLNSFNQQNRQSEAECRDGVDPAYVILGGTTSEDAEPGTYELFEVDLVNNNGSWETTYSEDLELPAGTYYLQHFAVYDSNDQVLWVAPREGGAFADEVGDALPLQVNLVAGTKPYIDVDVLCYYAREEAAYGYPFFDFDVVEVENSYCVFINYCDDETGREYPAYFNIDVYTDEAMTQEIELNNDTNTITMEGEWPSASVLCFALPDLGDETYYARVTVLDHEDLDYTAGAEDYYDFEITQASITALAAQEPAYHHIRIGCDSTPVINADTNIYIYFDSSGSMDNTLYPLQEMRNTLLRAALIGLYNNDDALFDEKVQVIADPSERTMHFLNLRGESPSGNSIALIFQDEAVYSYTDYVSSWDQNTTRTATYDADITALRGRLATWPSNSYNGIIFQVATPNSPDAENFAKFVSYVENGDGNYAGAYGLSDKSEIGYVYDVNPGDSPAYYEGLIVSALQSLGYSL
ncbi:hypothetical protein JRG66_01280 [Salinimicrobium tongyeongense]|jgi:hypothetical protein|uniref:VWFA domain-containing protein n=1 Tax=Salinimicrobium tongyeongense TaxID=2809707 RepID=A0ABY6NRN5_9FLAO|nr:hypothetical protein [Salinimicrobium tongyeongense]UZH55557.1 hypothetical protein JRG66_01280 [Salinimicrobium tongyeongense]